MTGTILSLAVAYAFLAVVAALMVLNTRLPLVLRGGVAIAVVTLIFVTYRGIGELRGLPSDIAPPERFRLYWAQIDEPDKLTGAPGSIFLWIRELDPDYFPIGLPRAHQLPYSDELAELVIGAMQQIEAGEDVAGEVEVEDEDEETAEELIAEANQEANESSGTRIGQRFIDVDFGSLRFDLAPAPVTPRKEEYE
jgi:hypothetical protein